MKGDLRRMWVIVFFDLPVTTRPQRTAAARFRNDLLNDGYMMLQFSVYARMCRAQEAVDKHIRRVQAMCPKVGSIRSLQVTDKQFARMKILLGNRAPDECIDGQQLLFF
jgi:CRISPR-associated protein Cas2